MSFILEQDGNKHLPRYEQIRKHLRQKIKDEGLKNGDLLPGIYSLANEYDVNYRTVKSAFDRLEKEGIISYKPNVGAMVVNPIPETKFSISYARWRGDAFNVGIWKGISRFTEENNINLVMVDAASSHQRFLDAITKPGNDIRGLLVMPFDLSEYREAVSAAMKDGKKVVFVDRVLPDMDVSSVTADHFTGGYQATAHLIEMHGRPVYYIGKVAQPSSCKQRVEGWTEAMREHYFRDIDKYIFDLPHTEAELSTSPHKAMEDHLTTAVKLFESCKGDVYPIFAGNDYVATDVYVAAEKLGLEIGKNVFIVGFGDVPLAQRMPVPLSSVCQNSEQVGYESAKLLYELITGAVERPMHRILPVELCIRASSIG